MLHALSLPHLPRCVPQIPTMEAAQVNEKLPPRLLARVTAVHCWALALSKGEGMGAAVTLFEDTWNTEARKKDGTYISAPRKYVPAQVEKVFHDGSLFDKHDTPHPHKMPDDKVKLAAECLAAGYSQQFVAVVQGNLYEWIETRHFTSMKQARQAPGPVRDLMEQYDVTDRYLLDRMHEVCPNLVYSALPIKIELTPTQRRARQEWASQMLARLAADPLYLEKIIWGDETRIYLGTDLKGKLKVYHFRGEHGDDHPEECRLLNKDNMIRLDVLLFVSAKHGCCHVEFLTGTTDIQRDGRSSQRMQANINSRMQSGKGWYKVSQ